MGLVQAGAGDAADIAGAAKRDYDDAGGEDDEGGPEDVGSKEMDNLHPDRGVEENVEAAEGELEEDQAEDGVGEFAGGGGFAGVADPDDGDNEQRREQAGGGMHPAEAEDPGAGVLEVLGESGVGEEGVAEGGEGSGDADGDGGGEADEGDAEEAVFDATVHEAGVTAEEMGGQGESGHEQKGVREMNGQDDEAAGGLVGDDVAKLDEERAEEGFVKQQESRGDGGDAGEMAGAGSSECPNEQDEDGEGRAAGHHAMGELDDGGDAGGGGDHFAIAERPVIAAACSGAGGADDRAPKDDEDVPGEDEPGVFAEPRGDSLRCDDWGRWGVGGA